MQLLSKRRDYFKQYFSGDNASERKWKMTQEILLSTFMHIIYNLYHCYHVAGNMPYVVSKLYLSFTYYLITQGAAMFITRPRSLYRNFPRTLFVQPSSQATYSGYLVVTDEESEEMDTFCFGMCKNNKISRLPFPQDRILKVVHTSEHQESHVTKVWFLPVPGQPLSSHRYFVIQAKGRHKGYMIQ